MRSSGVIWLQINSWALVEVPRYLYFVLDRLNFCPPIATIIRYSLFLVLYPTGITGELGVIYNSTDYIKENDVCCPSVLLVGLPSHCPVALRLLLPRCSASACQTSGTLSFPCPWLFTSSTLFTCPVGYAEFPIRSPVHPHLLP